MSKEKKVRISEGTLGAHGLEVLRWRDEDSWGWGRIHRALGIYDVP